MMTAIARTVREAVILERVMSEVLREYNRAVIKYGEFHSTHEGYAVMLEEMDELWDEVKTNGDRSAMALEAVQIAAMALRFLVDCCQPIHQLKGEKKHEQSPNEG